MKYSEIFIHKHAIPHNYRDKNIQLVFFNKNNQQIVIDLRQHLLPLHQQK